MKDAQTWGDVVRVPALWLRLVVLGGEFAECFGDTILVVSALLGSGEDLFDFVLLCWCESVEPADTVTGPFAGLYLAAYRVNADSVPGCHVLRCCNGLGWAGHVRPLPVGEPLPEAC